MKEYTKILITIVPEIMFGIMFLKYSILLMKERKRKEGGREGGKEEGSQLVSLSYSYMHDHTAYLRTDVQRE